ncbi:hypothetical protein KBT16_03880 [Nostoc sp. CCCryo 231-06]|nr:hypothetical protein [Nostoc sp. CCCryo 231-06]
MKQNTISIKDVAFFTELTTDEQALLVGGCSVETSKGTVIRGTKCVLKPDGTIEVSLAAPPPVNFLPPDDPTPSLLASIE